MPNEIDIGPVIGARSRSDPVDEVIAAIAGRRHGVVARWQLLAAGLGRRAIGHRVKAARLHVIYPGVYAVGHRKLSREGHLMGAVLLGGPGAVASGPVAAEHWGIRPASSRFEVTAPRERRNRPGAVFKRCRLRADEVTTLDGVPVTTVPRTIFDLAADHDRRQVERAMHEAEVRRLTDLLSLNDLVTRYPRRRGAPMIRRILADRAIGETVTRSELEARFLAFIDALGLPRPATNVLFELNGDRIEVDCVWRDRCLISSSMDALHTPPARASSATARATAPSTPRDGGLSG